MAANGGSVQSVDRTLDILEALSAAPQGMALSELAAATGLHVSTAHRLVNVLAERGYARKDTLSGKYQLTLRLFEIGGRTSVIWSRMPSIRVLLDQLAASSQQTVHLVERDGHRIVYLHKAEPYQQLVSMASYVGQRSPMYCTGVGKSILALLPGEEVLRIWQAEEICAFTPTTITEFHRLERELEQIRSRGYAMDDEEHEPGIRCIAKAVRNWRGEPVGAISISAPAARMDGAAGQQLLPQLSAAADEISRMLGLPGDRAFGAL